MFKRNVFFLVPVLFLFVFSDCGRRGGLSSLLQERDTLRVAMDVDMPGYFVLGGEGYGYQYDLLGAYADELGVELKVVPQSAPDSCARLLAEGKADIVATLSSHVEGSWSARALPVYTTSYVMLARKGLAAGFRERGGGLTARMLEGRSLMVPDVFRKTDDYGMLLDSLRGSNVFLSSRNSFDLMEELGDGKYDLLICEKSEAQLGCALVRNIEQVCAFPGTVSMSVVLGGEGAGLKRHFAAWLERYRNGEEYAMLNELYFERGIVGQFIGDGRRVPGGISAWDDLIRSVAQEEGYDWRLLSAIAYNESRFNAYIVSRRGARGLMQIMPVVARQFGVHESEIMKPEINVRLAARLLGKIERTLKLPERMPFEDRMSLILACYNGGIGHVMDARGLAAKYGGDPNSWADVSFFLRCKADPAYLEDEVVRHGRFTGSGETLAFVDRVMGKYRSYCRVVN
ncbi:MltF family protein [Gallalistipes aquisgranensis]|uniref:transglycosylase SLT domain-containing protein n=1 Tax=Gallalistipes aquisgranensis TaxID=2779358 RepID=UPI001CF8EF0A|nr:transglycosylase SLT domain-containing protein [Gallalistipes aquisgranensis]MBE5033955.1 transglycosylase SLT domain-containing protein [Gallalistipes aquisgranensis]